MSKSLRFFCIIFFALSFLAFPLLTYAHFAATDGTMTITLHIDPNDDPMPGQQAYIYFLFNDATKKFQLNQCNCIVTISEQGKQILQKKLIEKDNPHLSIWGANMPIVFPARNVYFITIQGSPIKPNAFKPFYLSWSFRADTSSPGIVKQGPSDIQILVGSWIAGIVVLMLIGWFIKKQVLSDDDVDSHKRH